jgi:hypothetical protein
MKPIFGTRHYRVGDPHALVEHCQLMAWLPYLTNLKHNPLHPRPQGLDTTLTAFDFDEETIQEAEQVSRLHLF